MRYPIKLVDDVAAFGPNMDLAVQMNDEVPVIIPDPVECPDVAACEPSCTKYTFVVSGFHPTGTETGRISIVTGTTLEGNTGDTVNFDITLAGYISLSPTKYTGVALTSLSFTLIPVVNTCGHRTRFLIDSGTMDWSFAVGLPLIGDPDKSETAVFAAWVGASVPSKTGSVQMQIDLTDAAPGSETWTDIGPIVNIKNF